MSQNYSGLENTRLRFQRLADARLFNGWVSMFSPERMVVQTEKELEVRPGERFHFEIHTEGEVCSFTGVLATCGPSLLEFELASAIKRAPSAEDKRVKVGNTVAHLQRVGTSQDNSPDSEGEPTPSAPEPLVCSVIDLSSQGIGLLSPEALEKGAKVAFKVFSPVGTIEGVAQVRYCRTSPKGHRVGLQIDSMERLDRGRYTFFMQSFS